jgi:hypothetical protein
MKATYLHLSRLRIGGALPPQCPVPSWRAQGKVCRNGKCPADQSLLFLCCRMLKHVQLSPFRSRADTMSLNSNSSYSSLSSERLSSRSSSYSSLSESSPSVSTEHLQMLLLVHVLKPMPGVFRLCRYENGCKSESASSAPTPGFGLSYEMKIQY